MKSSVNKNVRTTAPINKVTPSLVITKNSKRPKTENLLSHLMKKELMLLAKDLDMDCDELQAWIDLHKKVPHGTILNLLRTARRQSLDPLLQEIFFIQYENQWQVSISIDGWIRLIHEHPYYSGLTFNESSESENGLPVWIECTIYRSDRLIPTTTREYLCEVRNDTELWRTMPRRMLRHRALQQCARLALGIFYPEYQQNLIQEGNNVTENLNQANNQLIHQENTQINPLKTQTDRLKQLLIQKA
jgi:RecT family